MDKYKFIRSLRHYPLTRQQIKTLRGQALSGDVAGAVKGFRKCIESNRATACRKSIRSASRFAVLPGAGQIQFHTVEGSFPAG